MATDPTATTAIACTDVAGDCCPELCAVLRQAAQILGLTHKVTVREQRTQVSILVLPLYNKALATAQAQHTSASHTHRWKAATIMGEALQQWCSPVLTTAAAASHRNDLLQTIHEAITEFSRTHAETF